MLNQMLFFLLNGAGTLILETVWLKRQMILLGTTPDSYGSILFAYFLGIALGSWYYRNKQGLNMPRYRFYLLFLCSLLFSAIVPTVVFNLAPDPFHLAYSTRLNHAFHSLYRWSVTMICVVPSCFFLGAFFPLMSLTVNKSAFVLLYALQALGAALGLYLGSFLIPFHFGYPATFCAGFAVMLISLLFFDRTDVPRSTGDAARTNVALRPLVVAFFCGFFALTMQIVWIRFASISTDNSIYAFGGVSLIVIGLIAFSSFVTSRLPESWFKKPFMLHAILFLSLVFVIVSVRIFVSSTDNMKIVSFHNSFGLFKALKKTSPFIVAGYFFPSFILPFVIRSLKSNTARIASGPGKHVHVDRYDIGRLLFANGIGCAVGSILTSFVLLPGVGLWSTTMTAMFGYALFPILIDRINLRHITVPVGVILILVFNPMRYPLSTASSLSPGAGESPDEIIAIKEGKYGIVTVVDKAHAMRCLWLNNNYLLDAGSENIVGTRRMGILPVLLHPRAERVATIGVGTGILASGVVNSRIRDMTLIELIPEVWDLAAEHFAQYNQGVLERPDVRKVIADGRHYLNLKEDTYDIVVSDLFTPWNEGTSFLYTVEHFGTVRKRLNDDGLFCLWLPLFQLTEIEFTSILKSFLEVFPRATLWQIHMSAVKPTVALIGKLGSLDMDGILNAYQGDTGFAYEARDDFTLIHESGLFACYVAALSKEQFSGSKVPLNTLNRPVVEYYSAGSKRKMLQGTTFLRLIEPYYSTDPNPGGSYFTSFPGRMKPYRQAGWYMQLWNFHKRNGNREAARSATDKAYRLCPAFRMAIEKLRER